MCSIEGQLTGHLIEGDSVSLLIIVFHIERLRGGRSARA